MALTRKHLIIGTIVVALSITLIVGVTVGVVAGRRKPTPLTLEQQAHQILANNPLIDG
jgi:ABC-type dipeptide/oligopeptide/nickel transport system permease subunit